MKLSGNFMYLGYEEGKKKDGGIYHLVGLLQGLDSDKLFLSDELLADVSKIKPMSYVSCDLRINSSGEKVYTSLLSIKPLSAVQPDKK